MLTGTIPMESNKIEDLKSNYVKDEAKLIKEYDGKKPLKKILETFLVEKEGKNNIYI
jgi:hypothetical protein